MQQGRKIKSKLWLLKKDPPIWIDADFERLKKPTDDPHQTTMFKSKPIGVG